MDGTTGINVDATKTMASLTKTTEELASFGQGNIEAMMKAGQIWANGFESISRIVAATTQAHFDRSMANWKMLAGVRSLQEAMEVRSSLTHTSLQAFAETARLTEASMKIAEQTLAPITERITFAVEKLTHQVR